MPIPIIWTDSACTAINFGDRTRGSRAGWDLLAVDQTPADWLATNGVGVRGVAWAAEISEVRRQCADWRRQTTLELAIKG